MSIDANLRKERMTVDELLAEARLQQIGSLDESPVGRARVERQGQLHQEELTWRST